MLAGTRRGGQVSLPWGVSPGPRVPAVPPLVELLTPPVPLGGGAHLRQEDALHPAIPCSVLVVLSSVQQSLFSSSGPGSGRTSLAQMTVRRLVPLALCPEPRPPLPGEGSWQVAPRKSDFQIS